MTETDHESAETKLPVATDISRLVSGRLPTECQFCHTSSDLSKFPFPFPLRFTIACIHSELHCLVFHTYV